MFGINWRKHLSLKAVGMSDLLTLLSVKWLKHIRRSMNLYCEIVHEAWNCWVAWKHRHILGNFIFLVYLSIFTFANLSVNFAIITNSKMIRKTCLWGIFHISPYYKYLKWYSYLKSDHFIAHIFPYHLLTFSGNLENLMVLSVDTSPCLELETLCHTLSLS